MKIQKAFSEIGGEFCTGCALTESMEHCYTVDTGKILQFSKMYAYLKTEVFDDLNGDRGLTISEGLDNRL